GALGKWPTNGFEGICTPSMAMVADDGATDTESTIISMVAARGAGGGGATCTGAASPGGGGAGPCIATSPVVAPNTVTKARTRSHGWARHSRPIQLGGSSGSSRSDAIGGSVPLPRTPVSPDAGRLRSADGVCVMVGLRCTFDGGA